MTIRTRNVVLAAVPIAMSLILGLTFIACGGEQATAQVAPAQEPAAAQATVAKVVFIDQEKACDCTRARIDGSWAELQKVLEGGPQVPVVRIHGDSEEELAKPYLDMRPLLVAPGLYFIDAKGGLIEMLQGEVTESQITAFLK